MPLAITYATAGDPADVLAATEIPDPPPPGPGQVQIEVRALPIHPGDLGRGTRHANRLLVGQCGAGGSSITARFPTLNVRMPGF